ncbi:MAG TPA: glycosyl hydrolase, partial [Chitinophagaceae bacterium]|nr:glycosyl hydrolase [Chitinophagaceae bacterium]
IMLDRRALLKNTILSSTGLIVLSGLPLAGDDFFDVAGDELAKGFLNPPNAARPQAFWMWMNGHITKKGITLDLQLMKKMGLAGAFIYDTGAGIPKGPVDYGSSQWDEMVIYAMTEAKRLGLELFLHNSPGFSSTGGPWVLPEMTMQQLVWSETIVNSRGSIDIQLPQPYKKLNYYKDAVVIAYPSLVVEKALMKDKIVRILLNETEIDKNILLQSAPASKIELNGTIPSSASLLLEFSEPFEARAITVLRQKELAASIYEGNYDNPPSFLLESSDDGTRFQTVCTIIMPLLRFMDAPGTKSFPAVKAKYFRLSTRQYAAIAAIELHAGPRLSGWPAKINFTDQEIIPDNQEFENELIIDPSRVINISDRLQPDGRLIWNAGAGNWTILRFGHTCTGTKTAGAPGSAFGLEIDKFSKEAVNFYFVTFLDKLFEKLKPFTADPFKGVLIDSWEIGKQNWTSNFISDFKQKRNYDITPWLPALTGRIVKGTEDTEKFLWDIRKTHADLVAENYYGGFKDRCKEYNLALFAQPNGDGVFDSLQVGQYPDSSLAEFWTRYVPGTLNVCKQAVSIAHGYGKKIVAAEAYTGMPSTSRWTEYPYALKSQGDHIYSLGINRFVFHVFVHQPYSNGLPGMTMGPYGTHFDRNSTWADRSKEWINYITRTQYLLQQGLPVCDICYFKGEDPGSGIPDINYVDPPTPKYLAGDVIGPDVLLRRIRIDNNKIVLPDGMSYSLMIMAPVKATSLQVISKLKELVFAGMNLIVASKPSGTPGLHDRLTAAEIDDLVNGLWGGLDGSNVKERSYGKGMIYWNKPFAEILAKHKIIPDFEFTAKNKDAAIHYTHRKSAESEIYFLSNRLRRTESIVCSFRFYNKKPEIWNAETGEIFEVALYEIKG